MLPQSTKLVPYEVLFKICENSLEKDLLPVSLWLQYETFQVSQLDSQGLIHSATLCVCEWTGVPLFLTHTPLFMYTQSGPQTGTRGKTLNTELWTFGQSFFCNQVSQIPSDSVTLNPDICQYPLQSRATPDWVLWLSTLIEYYATNRKLHPDIYSRPCEHS